jgi:hypothetical protein
MRHLLIKVIFWLLLGVMGAALVAVAAFGGGRIGDVPRLLSGVLGAALGALGLLFFLRRLPSAIGEIQLRSRIGLLARWRVSPEDWEAFRAFDAKRSITHPTMGNILAPRRAPRSGVEVRFGRDQVLANGAYFRLSRSSVPRLRTVVRLQVPDAPECLEFGLAYEGVRLGRPPAVCLRLPVPATAQAEAKHVLDRFRSADPDPLPSLTERNPWLVIGAGLVVTLALGSLAGLALWMRSGGDQSLTMLLLLLASGVFAVGAALFTIIVTLMLLPWGQPRD